MSSGVVFERYWAEKFECADFERTYYENLAKEVQKKSKVPEMPSKGSRKGKDKSNENKSHKKSVSSDVDSKPIVANETNVISPPEEIKVSANIESVEEVVPKDNKDKEMSDANIDDKIVDTNTVLTVVSTDIEKGGNTTQTSSDYCSLASEVAKARQHIKKSLECMDSVLANVPGSVSVNEMEKKYNKLSDEFQQLKVSFTDLQNVVMGLRAEIQELKQPQLPPRIAICPPCFPNRGAPVCMKPQQPPPPPKVEDDDDGVDLFGSDSEDDNEAAKIREQRLAEYAAKKSKKPALIAKSSIILDVKPWDDETDMKAMEVKVRSIESDGLLWGASKLVPLAYGIMKLQINCVIEDDKISVDWLQEEIEKFEDLVQSVDVAAFNKI